MDSRCGSQIEGQSAKLEGTRLMKDQDQDQTTQKTARVVGFQTLTYYRKLWDLVPQEYSFHLINNNIKLFVARNVPNGNTYS